MSEPIINIQALTIILFIFNILIFLIIAILGFWFKSLYNKLERLSEEFVNKDMCKQKHQGIWDNQNNFKESLSEFKKDMKDGFDRIEEKLDLAKNLADGISEIVKKLGN